jgi:hypothetical protein
MSALRSPASPVRVARAVSARWVTPVIAATGVLIEAALIVNLLVPLWIGRRPGRITDWEPLSAMIGATPVGLARFALTLALWIGGYVLVLRLCWSHSRCCSRSRSCRRCPPPPRTCITT